MLGEVRYRMGKAIRYKFMYSKAGKTCNSLQGLMLRYMPEGLIIYLCLGVKCV